MAKQKCPACGVSNDISVFVSGQRILCRRCGLPFVVHCSEPIARDAKQRRPGPRVHLTSSENLEEKVSGAKSRFSLPLTSTPSRNVQIPGFELYEIIGRGGMGDVYRAKQVSLNRVVAVKILNEDLAKHKSFIKRFEKETASLASLSHPNISVIIDRGHVGLAYFFVMEFIDGLSLRSTSTSRVLEFTEISEIFVILCRAVEYAHQHGVIHRDLKPENVLFTRDGVLKIVDFGLANILTQDQSWELTCTKVSMGTANYMAPEQRRDAKHVDHRADIYSLGVILYELLTHELPLGRFDPPSKRRQGIDERVDQLVLKMLDFDPDRRPQSAGLIGASIENILGEKVKFSFVKSACKPDKFIDSHQEHKEKSNQGSKPQRVCLSALSSYKRRKIFRRSNVSYFLVFFAMGVVLTGAIFAGRGYLRIHSEFSRGDKDLMLIQTKNDAPRARLIHPHPVVQYTSPSINHLQGNKRVIRIDFNPSPLATLSVRFIGGNWQLRQGVMTQDSCESQLVINQVPAKALIGNTSISTQGLTIKVLAKGERYKWKTDEGIVSFSEFLDAEFRRANALLPFSIEERMGVGFINAASEGIEVLVSLSQPGFGQVLRIGENMEGKDTKFFIEQIATSKEEQLELGLKFLDGQVEFNVNDKRVFSELAGFPLGFKGFPALVCQNVRCRVYSIEYSHQRL